MAPIMTKADYARNPKGLKGRAAIKPKTKTDGAWQCGKTVTPPMAPPHFSALPPVPLLTDTLKQRHLLF
jgi:hypothetical protein